MSSQRIRVEVVYAQTERQTLRQLELDDGATAADAVMASGLWADFPELDPTAEQFARYGCLIGRQARLSDGDRIEILRPLFADPKEARRMSAAQSGQRDRRSGRTGSSR
jgi:putative ubiquitin-RnfH superfamily antitoxin RatB of RatAB toxin-antitoxin module